MQQFTQRHSNTIAIGAVSASVLILLVSLAGAVASRSRNEPQPQTKPQESTQQAAPQATPAPSPTATPSEIPSPTPSTAPQTAAPLQSPQTQTTVIAIAASVLVERTELKAEPNAASQTVGRFHQKQIVAVLNNAQLEGGWYAVSVGAMSGYVPARAITTPMPLSAQTRQYTPQPQESQGAIQLPTQSL